MGAHQTAAPTRRPRAPLWPWFLLVAMAVIGTVVIRIAIGPGEPPTAREFEGRCVTTTGGVIQLAERGTCDGAGEGRVVDVVDRPEDCPGAVTDERFSLEGDSAVVCIDNA